jgi:hypothetical protein
MSRHRLYFDESGVHSLPKVENLHGRYLALCGVIFEEEDCRKFQNGWEAMKSKFFDVDPDEPIILHRKELMSKSGLFSVLEDAQKRAEFDAAFLEIVTATPFTSVIVVIDKASHQNSRNSPLNPYHYCLVSLLRQYCFWLGSRTGDVMGESRGRTEDQQLKAIFSSLFLSGDWRNPPKFYQAHLTSKDIKLFPKMKNTAGLQLADLLAHPAKTRCLVNHGVQGVHESPFGTRVADAFWTKLRKSPSGDATGYGEIFIS